MGTFLKPLTCIAQLFSRKIVPSYTSLDRCPCLPAPPAGLGSRKLHTWWSEQKLRHLRGLGGPGLYHILAVGLEIRYLILPNLSFSDVNGMAWRQTKVVISHLPYYSIHSQYLINVSYTDEWELKGLTHCCNGQYDISWHFILYLKKIQELVMISTFLLLQKWSWKNETLQISTREEKQSIISTISTLWCLCFCNFWEKGVLFFYS